MIGSKKRFLVPLLVAKLNDSKFIANFLKHRYTFFLVFLKPKHEKLGNP
jgi:hypothetical protein